MELIIHAGMDKCGSSAIQAHLNIYREWFLQQGVYIPKCGLSSWGHPALFQEMDPIQWQLLVEELEQASGFSRALLSFEGVHFLDTEQLGFVQRQLQEYDLTFLFYLREQSQIIQSGYLQKLKKGKQSHTLANFQDDGALLFPASRDYALVLKRMQKVFPEAGISVRHYDLRRFKEGSILFDFLDFLGLAPLEEFAAAKVLQNISLDIEAAEILNVFDAYGGSDEGRADLVEDLLFLVQKNRRPAKRFLGDEAVRKIRQHYANSNQWLLRHYGVDLTSTELAQASTAPSSSPTGGHYLARIAALARFPRWSGAELTAEALAEVLSGSRGWSGAGRQGTWSLGSNSRICFRIGKPSAIEQKACITVCFGGEYLGDNNFTQLSVNGVLLGEFNLSEAEVLLPEGVPGDDGIVELTLKHLKPVSPASLAMNEDDRELAYRLQALSCCFGPLDSPACL